MRPEKEHSTRICFFIFLEMASLTMKPALPSKKRKNSFGSEGQSSSSETATRIRRDSSDNEHHHSSLRNIAESRLPSKKRKSSHDSSLLGINANEASRKGNRKGSNDLSVSFEDGLRPRGPSGDSMNGLLESDTLSKKITTKTPFLKEDAQKGENDSSSNNEPMQSAVPNVALEHLNALAENLEVPPRERSNSVTFAAAAAPSTSIIEPKSIAELKKDVPVNDDHSTSSTTTSGHRLLFEAIMMKEGDYDERRRLNSWGGKSLKDESQRGRLDSLGHSFLDGIGRDRLDSMPPSFEEGITRERLDSLGGWRGARDRLESWGAMSDLSLPLGHDSISGQVLPPHQPPFLDSLGDDLKHSNVPNRISLERQRLSSIASMSEVSVSQLPFLQMDAVADSAGDIQAYVAAAMASVSDQIADLAGVVETVANSADSVSIDLIHRDHLDSDASSVASPLIGAATDSSRRKRAVRPRSWSTSSGLSLDFDAVVAAVNAAEAATGKLDLSFIGRTGSANSISHSGKVSSNRRTLPTQRTRGESIFTQTSEDISEEEKERIRERARAVAGYKPGSNGSLSKKKSGPIKKRSKRDSPEKEDVTRTPKHSNSRHSLDLPDDAPLPPQISSASPLDASSSSAIKGAKGQASQKWDSMFDCLLEFITDRKSEETAGMTQKDIDEWMWDGNVPTNYKTKCGKALGRWVNNQRSAKSKGTLKDDREERLIDAGLKWSVMAGNAWNEMLKELRVYVDEQTKDGATWDGNVPTTYQIKTSEESAFAGEDKNLGRWVNRQRSLFQSGKLRKDRKAALDKLGLKWSMLATTTWDCMWETLREYVQEQEKAHGKWDGNVPANYKTNDNPPRALGRWINRQRSAYMKKKLKKECVEKLTNIGLKWSVHQRQGEGMDEDDNGDDCEFMDEVESEYNEEAAQEKAADEVAENKEAKTADPGCQEKAANQEEKAAEQEDKVADPVTSTTTSTI
ncbi:hypothetical protein FisN_37Hh003 [Fistulifera solaris]|uniref:Helicase-associated domain-containing protein n=1 Tax=Fistulifera solaris TaxID=1519565 RepID=A0A1Z5KJR9_FISSO|nr:hypothetical protein FisN_37Hh003 [Fistulifera solaris]|eukprot:GAX26447.1 hypothetical protein FisN_37Hh003 [Fistulifera solaris]